MNPIRLIPYPDHSMNSSGCAGRLQRRLVHDFRTKLWHELRGDLMSNVLRRASNVQGRK